MPLHIIDTAGLRDANDEGERIGIERAWRKLNKPTGYCSWSTAPPPAPSRRKSGQTFIERLPAKLPITVVRNKADVTSETLGISKVNGHSLIRLSARTGEGVDVLRNHLKSRAWASIPIWKAVSSCRRRHLQALSKPPVISSRAKRSCWGAWAGELLAEELRLAQQALSEITGEFTSDDLLGRIFSSFCIGK